MFAAATPSSLSRALQLISGVRRMLGRLSGSAQSDEPSRVGHPFQIRC
jgi:hypothetical protein